MLHTLTQASRQSNINSDTLMCLSRTLGEARAMEDKYWREYISRTHQTVRGAAGRANFAKLVGLVSSLILNSPRADQLRTSPAEIRQCLYR